MIRAINLMLQYGVLLMCLAASSVSAMSVDELVSAGRLTVDVRVRVAEEHIVGQPALLEVEVATQRWFAKGSRVEPFNIADVVILQGSELAINGSKSISGKTWVSQIHEVTLYPTRVGRYELPPLSIYVSVNTEEHGVVEGVTLTDAKTFEVLLPKELQGIDQFIVSPNFSVSLDGEFSSEQPYAVGESVSQTITLTAEDSPAMMLPELMIPEIEGVSIYRKPSEVQDKANRGSLTGTRTESFTYIFERSGSFTIPQQTLYWWNSQSQELQEVLIDEQTWDVTGAALVAPKSLAKLEINWTFLSYIFYAAVVLSCVWLCFQYRYALFNLYSRLTRLERRTIKSRFYRHLKTKNYLAATQELYRWYALPSDGVQALRELLSADLEASKTLEILFRLVFSIGAKGQSAPFTREQGSSLLNARINEAHSVISTTLGSTIELNR